MTVIINSYLVGVLLIIALALHVAEVGIIGLGNRGNTLIEMFQYLVENEMAEIIALSDRIIVFFEGKIIAEFPSSTDSNIIGLAMAGVN